MFSLKSKWLAPLCGAAAIFAASAMAQDNQALLNALVRKGILNTDEAQQIGKEVAAGNAASKVSTKAGKHLRKLTISGLLQVQYAGLGTDIDGTAADPASTNHFFLRRMYLGAKAELTNNWLVDFNYDFAGSTFDAAYIGWKQSDAFHLDLGLRKVAFGLEEWGTSSGSLKAIERSPATRYFVEGNNGRRLGAGSYRTGVFAGGKNDSGFTYNVAVTNPERDESFSGVTSAGNAGTNVSAIWGNVGYGSKFTGGSYRASFSAGSLPDQGGKILGAGDNLTVYNSFVEITTGAFNLQAEYFLADNEQGVAATQDAKPTAWSIQPAYRIGDFEVVVRYTDVDSDGRGVTLSDGVRSSPSGGTMNKMNEIYFGGNWYISGDNTKFQLGYIHAESKDTVTGGPAKATTNGIRSQMQINF